MSKYKKFQSKKVQEKFDNYPKSIKSRLLSGDYTKFTTESGKMPEVVISAWQEIWAMKENDFDGKRKYIADFEIYDERAIDPNNTVIDIYIGVEK